jgi:cell division septation protein DedD
MDLPVIGRFFGSTSDQLTRTELIMLITPHVIRSRDQGQQITEDFKKSLSTVRNELDRMSREREKLQQQPLQQKPALPGPSGDVVPAPNPPAPAPAPSAAPSGSGASVTPLKKIAADSAPSASSDNMLDLMSVAAPEAVKMAPSAGIVSTDTKNPQQTGVPKPAPQPAYALSVTSRPEIPSNAAAPKPISSRPQVPLKPIQIWTVQVAAMARREDAEALAGMLRDKGYDAYVVTADVNAKTWHRVRVGQSPAIGDASQLQRTLKSSERFEAAYVVASR